MAFVDYKGLANKTAFPSTTQRNGEFRAVIFQAFSWHSHTLRLTGATVGFLDDQRFRQIARWTKYFWEYDRTREKYNNRKKDGTLKSDIVADAHWTAGQPIHFEQPLISHMQNKVSIVPKLWCADYVTLSALELLQ